MSALSAEALARSSASWTWEVRDGQPCRRRCLDWQWRRAAGIARLLEPAAAALGAWVSTEALVRVRRRPETALRPAIAVVAGGLP